MKNLAGDKTCDVTIKQELTQAGIKQVQHSKPLRREVPASVTGVLTLNGQDSFTFTRAWYYWVVNGDVPLDVALEMYADKVGRDDVRVEGCAGNDDPANWAFPRWDVVAKYVKEHKLEFLTNSGLAQLCNSGKITAPRFVAAYHIDSQEGLNLFVVTLRKHGLVN